MLENPEFPENYIDYIKSKIGKVDYILVSSHISVREALDKAGLSWVFVKPDKSLRDEYIGRCYMRGDDEIFIKALVDNWDEWVGGACSDPMPNGLVTLSCGEYLMDHMHFIENDYA